MGQNGSMNAPRHDVRSGRRYCADIDSVPLLYYEVFKEKVCPLRAEEFELKVGEKESEKDEN